MNQKNSAAFQEQIIFHFLSHSELERLGNYSAKIGWEGGRIRLPPLDGGLVSGSALGPYMQRLVCLRSGGTESHIF